jgi:hypothetical protein
MSKLPSRIASGIAIIVLAIVAVRLIFALFAPILPHPVAQLVGQGASLVYGLVAPALPAAMALLMLWGLLWLFGRSRGK